MSRKNNRKRRKDRRKRKVAWEEFHGKYPDTGSNFPAFVFVIMERQKGLEFASRQKRAAEMANFGKNRIQQRKNKLEIEFKSCWRGGVEALGVEGWEKDRSREEYDPYHPLDEEN